MGDFLIYFQLGFSHITDFQGFDHMLFLLALCGVYSIQNWKALAWLVTAFTLGHCLTLVVAGMDIVVVNTAIIEFLIPVTILVTAVSNFFVAGKNESKKRFYLKYAMAGLFGLVHGLGFSNYFRSLFSGGMEVAGKLFAFNTGIEAGQLLIVAAILLIGYLLNQLANVKFSYIRNSISTVAALAALVLMYQTKFW